MRHVVAALLVSLSGCYAIARGRQGVEVTSDPPGARVVFNGAEGVTPCVLEVPRSSAPRMVRFQLDGREGVQQEVTPTKDRFSWPFFLGIGDALLIVPLVVELIIYDPFFDWPERVSATLAVEGKPSSIWVERD